MERGRGAGRDAGNLITELNFAHTYRSRAVQLEPKDTPRCGTGCSTLPFFASIMLVFVTAVIMHVICKFFMCLSELMFHPLSLILCGKSGFFLVSLGNQKAALSGVSEWQEGKQK